MKSRGVCDRLRAQQKRLKDVACCPECHGMNVLYPCRAGRVCCKIGEVIIIGFDFIYSVEKATKQQATK